MMITLSLLIVGLCLFLHRKLKSTTGSVSLHTLPWSEENLEVFTLSGQVRFYIFKPLNFIFSLNEM